MMTIFRRRIARTAVTAVGLVFALVLSSADVRAGELADPASQSEQAMTDADAKKIAEEVKASLRESKTIQAGLSLGWRTIPRRSDRQFRDVALNAAGVLLLDESDANSVVLSGVVTAYPFRDSNSRRKDLGFVANLNLADFSADSVGMFNKSIEGGLGLAWRLNPDFAVAFTIERAFSRSLRNGIDPLKPLLDGDGKPLGAIDRNDPRYFHDDHVTAISLKWVYLFGG